MTTELVIKIDQNGFLAGFVPKPVWYALYKQGIIKKESDKWKVDLTKRDQIRIPLEIVGSEGSMQSQPRSKQNTKLFKEIFFEALKFAEEQTESFKKRMFEELPLYAVGEPADTLASLQGKPSPLKNIRGYMLGNCGFVSIRGLKFNKRFGRFVAQWEKQCDAPFSITGHSLHINLKALMGGPIEAQCMELNEKAYRYFLDKLDDLLVQNGLEPSNFHIWSHID